MSNSEYMLDLEIDEFSLDQEWIRQPILYMKYAELLATKNNEKQILKERIDIAKAESDQRARKEIEKPTEAKVSAFIQRDKEVQKVLKQYNDICYEASLYQAAVNAFEHKKRSLEKLVDLYLSGFYSAPKQRNREGFTEKIETKKSDTLNKKLNKKRNK